MSESQEGYEDQKEGEMERAKVNMRVKCLWFVLGLGIGFLLVSQRAAFALEQEEVEKLQAEIKKLEQEDPELADAVKGELKEAVGKGEIELTGESKDYYEGDKEWRGGDDQGRPAFDLSNPEDRTKMLAEITAHEDEMAKMGLSKDDISNLKEMISKGDIDEDKMKEIFEKTGEQWERTGPGHEGVYSREEMEKGMEMFREMGLEHYAEGDAREMFEKMDKDTQEKMMKEFADREQNSREQFEKDMKDLMGREPTEQERAEFERQFDKEREAFEREALEHGGYDREAFEREGLERGGYDRESFEREALERGGFEREAFERDAREYAERETHEREAFEREREAFEHERPEVERPASDFIPPEAPREPPQQEPPQPPPQP